VAFTGGSVTAKMLREKLAARGVRLNVEADSLNAAVLGPDVAPGSAAWDLFVADVARDLTQKAGQKCTAIRRVFVPRERLAAARAPHAKGVFGPVATLAPFAIATAAEQARAAADLVARGGGSLVCSAFSDDRAYLAELALALAPHHGRLYLAGEKVAGQTH